MPASGLPAVAAVAHRSFCSMLFDRASRMLPRIKEVDREQLTEGEHVELAVEGTGHRVYITAVRRQTVVVVSNGCGEQASISLDGDGWRVNKPE